MDQSSPNRSPTIAVDLPVAALPTRHMRAPLIVVLGLGFTLIWIALLGYGSVLLIEQALSAENGNFCP